MSNEIKKMYISGKVTGLHHIDVFKKFSAATGYLLDAFPDYEIIVPLALPGIHSGLDWDKAMEICLAELETYDATRDAIYMLSDWKDSKGAKDEHAKALELGLQIFYQEQ